jgi:glycosyltransferase involved in cell wall biosynthesis
MHILQTLGGAEKGGAETFFVRLVLALHRAGQRQTVAIRGWPGRMAELRAGGVEPVALRFGGALDLATPRTLRRLIRSSGADVALSWMNRATTKTPSDAIVHVGRVGHYYDPKYYRRCDALITITRDLRRHMIDGGFPAERVHYVPNFYTPTTTPALARADRDTPDDAPLLVAVGRLHVNKAFDVLLDAVADMPGVWLWIAGEGPARAALEAQIARLGLGARVRLLGWQSDPGAVIRAGDLMVVPSRSEGFGTVLLEAWGNRRPLVAADSEGPRETVEDGRTGLMVPMNDADALRRAMQRVLDSPELAHDLVERGWEAFQAGFTESVVVAQYRAVLGEALRQGKRQGRRQGRPQGKR